MYVFLATSNGFVLFKGHEASAGENANQYGWTWQEVIGKTANTIWAWRPRQKAIILMMAQPQA